MSHVSLETLAHVCKAADARLANPASIAAVSPAALRIAAHAARWSGFGIFLAVDISTLGVVGLGGPA